MKEILESFIDHSLFLNKVGIFPQEVIIKLGERSFNEIKNRINEYHVNISVENPSKTNDITFFYAGVKYTFKKCNKPH